MYSIFLSGFMGCGKSTVAKTFSRRTETPVIDLDEYIEKKVGAKIPDIFRDFGEEAFRKMEAEAIRELSGKNAIIACGGGTMTDGKNYGAVKLTGGFVIFIDTPFALCLKRIREDGEASRPVAAGKTDQELADLYVARHPLYEKNCDEKVDGLNPSLVIASDIMRAVAELIDARVDEDIAVADKEEAAKAAKAADADAKAE